MKGCLTLEKCAAQTNTLLLAETNFADRILPRNIGNLFEDFPETLFVPPSHILRLTGQLLLIYTARNLRLPPQARWDPMQNTHWRPSWKKHLRIFFSEFLDFFKPLNWTFSNQLMDKEVKENSAICSSAISKSFSMYFQILSTGREHNCEINSSCWRKEKFCKSQD